MRKSLLLPLILLFPLSAQAQSVMPPDEEQSLICTIALGLNMSLFGTCIDPRKNEEAMPTSDPDVYGFTPPPEPTPPPKPEFKPIIIEQKVQTPPIQLPASKPPIEVKPAPKPVVKPAPVVKRPKIDYAAISIQQAYLNRVNGQAWTDIETIPNFDSPTPSNLAISNNGFNAPKLNTNSSLPEIGKLSVYDQRGASQIIPEGTYQQSRRDSGFPVDNSRILTNDRYITGILETGINSQIGNTAEDDEATSAGIIIQVARDVYGYHDRLILIPKGSRMVCDYIAPDKAGISRIGIICNRLLLAGNRAEIYDLQAIGTDAQGRDGIVGEVDNRFGEKYGTAFALAGISAAVRLSTAAIPTEDETSTGEILDQGSEELSSKLGEITASILEETVNLNPIITIPQGTRITIRPKNDIYLKPIPTN